MFWNSNRKLVRALDHLVLAHVRKGTFSGTVLVTHKGSVLLRKGYGFADYELEVAASPENVFDLGSISKSFTALLVMRLIEQGKLNTHDPLEKFLPNFPGANAITIHHLLTNTSGIPDFTANAGFTMWNTHAHSVIDLIERFQYEPPLFAPGEKFGYSNSNWVLLARVIETLTQRYFADALRTFIFKPLGLTQSYFAAADKFVPKRAKGYILETNHTRPADLIHPTMSMGNGGVLSTVNDLSILHHVLNEAKLWRPETLQHMFTPYTKDDLVGGYGYGFISSQRWNRRFVGHTGYNFGYAAAFTRYLDDDLLIVVLSNLENGSALKLEIDLAAVFFEKYYGIPGETGGDRELSLDLLRSYSGTYRGEYMSKPFDLQLQLHGTDLIADMPPLPKTKLTALAENRFVGRLKGGEVIFEIYPEHIEMNWSGFHMTAIRIVIH